MEKKRLTNKIAMQSAGLVQSSLIQNRELHRNMLREMSTSIATGMSSGNVNQNLTPEAIAEDSVKVSKEILNLLGYDDLTHTLFEFEDEKIKLIGNPKKNKKK